MTDLFTQLRHLVQQGKYDSFGPSCFLILTRQSIQKTPSLLGCLLFNIYLNDSFLEIGQTNICNFPIDRGVHQFNVEPDSNLILEWFRDNYMTLNESKCHLIVCGYKHECISANIGNTRVWEEHSAKLLGVHIDTESLQEEKLVLCQELQRICQRAKERS